MFNPYQAPQAIDEPETGADNAASPPNVEPQATHPLAALFLGLAIACWFGMLLIVLGVGLLAILVN